MANVAVIGAQWGDEGKGKIVDWLSERAEVVVRFQGGHNAGHTLVIGNQTYKLALLPSGVVRKGKLSIIGNGVVVDPWHFLEEVKKVSGQGVSVTPENLKIANHAVLILPLHRDLDGWREDAPGTIKIGTTRRGIGPAYEDKVGRRAIRVGDGPFPTELKDDIGQLLGDRGNEFGTNTGRRRRCGWFDAVMVRQAVKLNGIDGIALTKLDVLDGLSEIKVCVGYELDGKTIERFPFTMGAQAKLKPVWETFEGWNESTKGARSFAELPATCIKYVRRVEELVGCPVALLSTSPEREDTILMTDPFRD